MKLNLSGKLALIAGGTGGLGSAVTLAFLAEGLKVAVTYQQQNQFDALRKAVGPNYALLEGHRVDVTEESAAVGLIERLLTEHNRLDILVNCVGAYVGGVKLWELDSPTFDRMLALNLRSGYVLTRAAVPVMLKQGKAAIVNVIAKAAVDHAAGAGAYAASKAAALAMMDSLAADLKGTGVRVNSILPSIIDTEVNRRAMPDADFTPWPKPEDIARVILFLCSDEAKVIHGAALPVYGDS
jgi:NAD(P)-dependent dehydrogenase (short-subunit alcohol dehydrogenase family)